MIALPEVSLDDVIKGLRVFKSDLRIGYILPFTYAPKLIRTGYEHDNSALKQLSPKHQEQLACACLCHMDFDKAGNLTCMELLNLDFTKKQHYHSSNYRGESDCLGDMTPIQFKTIKDIYANRDTYQKVTEIVNMTSLMMDKPKGIPYACDLKNEAIKVDPKIAWVTLEEPTKNNGDIVVGSRVKVISRVDSWASENIGSIGTVIEIYSRRLREYRVEFLFSFNSSHEGCCYDFTRENIELMPPETPRTRDAGIASRHPELNGFTIINSATVTTTIDGTTTTPTRAPSTGWKTS
jgi:hypothetical protein